MNGDLIDTGAEASSTDVKRLSCRKMYDDLQRTILLPSQTKRIHGDKKSIGRGRKYNVGSCMKMVDRPTREESLRDHYN